MFYKLLKKLVFIWLFWMLSGAPEAYADLSEIRKCGLEDEIAAVDVVPPSPRVKLKWGVNVPDYANYIANIPNETPARVAAVVANLRSECVPSRIAANSKLSRACEFLVAHSSFIDVQNELHSLLATHTFLEHPQSPDELVFRGLNWSLNPFSENVAASLGERSRAVRVMVKWMLMRKSLSARIDAVGVYYASLRPPKRATALRATIPAIKAYYASPLLVGQMAHFLKNQNCVAKELPACREANYQLTVWMIEQVQETRTKLLDIKCLFESRLTKMQAAGTTPIEIDILGQLYKQDQAFARYGDSVVEQYSDYLEQSAATLFSSSSDFSNAKLGLVVASELLHVFKHAIPDQPPLTSEIIHPAIAPLERKISREINEPIQSLQYFIDQFGRNF